jgi:hypothetical protein
MFSGVPGADGVANGQAGQQRHGAENESRPVPGRRPPPGYRPAPTAQFQDIVTTARPVTVRNGHPSNLFHPPISAQGTRGVLEAEKAHCSGALTAQRALAPIASAHHRAPVAPQNVRCAPAAAAGRAQAE